MADFSSNVTTLSAPTGAGASPIAPATVNTFPGQLVEGIVNIFNKGLTNNAKEAAEKRKQEAVSGYVKAETAINSGFSSGELKPHEAAARSRANFNKYASGFSEYIEEFQKAGNALKGFTEAGVVQDVLASEKKTEEAQRQNAINRGFVYFDGMSKEAAKAQDKAAQTSLAAEVEMRRYIQEQSEKRSQGTYDVQVADREVKNLSTKLLSEIGGDNVEAFHQLSVTLGDQVRSGKMSPETAQATLTQRYANISSAIAATAGSNPELAGAWNRVFTDLNSAGKLLLDPKTTAENYKSQVDSILAKSKLLVLTRSPEVRAAVVANQFFPMNPTVSLRANQAANEVHSMLSTTRFDSGEFIPQAIGNPAVETEVLTLAKASLEDLMGKKLTSKEAEEQGLNSVNNILKQTGNILTQGTVTPSKLKNVAAFIASPAFGQMAATGKIDPQANLAAKQVFQLMYEKDIVKGVNSKLDEFIYGQASFGQKQKDPVKLGDAVEVSFSGSGVVFTPKKMPGLDIVEAASLNSNMKQLEVIQKAVNQVIHIGAHLEGSTDYKAVWEANRHKFLPGMFTPPVADKLDFSTEAGARNAAKLTPAEQARGDIYDQSNENLSELQREIDAATNPKIKAILQQELTRLTGKK